MFAFSTATLVSVLALASSLTGIVHASGPRTLCTETWEIEQGETCKSVGAQPDVSMDVNAIQLLNPGIDCDGALPVGSVLCLERSAPNCTRYERTTESTCGALASQFNIHPEVFVQLNNDVNKDCSDLVVDQVYCVSVSKQTRDYSRHPGVSRTTPPSWAL